MPRIIAPERIEQEIVVKWLRALGIRVVHVPNGGKRDIVTAVRLKDAGVQAGVPDLLIFKRPPIRPTMVGVAIEMKRAKGGRVSDAQQDWLDYLVTEGWHTMVCHGADDAMLQLKMLGYADLGRG